MKIQIINLGCLLQPLSDETHYNENDEHNPEYDHEAFLGEEDAKSFDQLTPEESKTRLAWVESPENCQFRLILGDIYSF